MANYYIERTVHAVVTLIVVITLAFGMFRLIPGGPMDYIRSQIASRNPTMTRDEIEALAAAYANMESDAPLYEQYIDYVTGFIVGDFGESMYYGTDVADIVAQALPWTLFLMSIALFISFAINVALGAAMAYREGTAFDYAFTGIGIVASSIPYYLVAIIFVAYLGYEFNLFPTRGAHSADIEPGLTVEFIGSILHHAALPLGSMIVTGFAGGALSMRGNCMSILGEDYLRVARLRGLPESRISLRYVARNGVLPMYTGMMIQIGAMFGGSVILEQIFTYPGLGYYTIQALNARDYPLLMGTFILITVATILGIYVADLTYGYLDPRAAADGGSA